MASDNLPMRWDLRFGSPNRKNLTQKIPIPENFFQEISHPQNIDCHINKTGYDNPRLPKPSPIRAPYIGIEASCMNHEMIQITLIISTAPYN